MFRATTPIETFVRVAGYYIIQEENVNLFRLKNIQCDFDNFRHLADYTLPIRFEALEIKGTDFTTFEKEDFERILRLIKLHTTSEVVFIGSTLK